MRKSAAQSLLLFALTTAPWKVFAQLPDYNVKLLTEQQGLRPSEFISIAKDGDGFLWLLSQSTVQRYDGKQSWSFTAPAGAAEIFVDRQGRRWLLCRRSLHRFVNNYRGFTQTLATGEERSTVCLFYLRNVLHLLLSDGLLRFDEKGDKFVPVETPFLPHKKGFGAAYALNSECLFFADADSVYSLQLTNLQLRATAFKRLSGLVALSDNRVFAGNQRLQTFLLQPGDSVARQVSAEQLEGFSKTTHLRIFNGVPLGAGAYHLSTNKGLLLYDSRSNRFSRPVLYHRGEKLASTTSVRGLFKDGDGTVYMTHADGVAFYHPARSGIGYIRAYAQGNASLPDMDVRSFAEDNEGFLWIATLDGLARLNRKTGELKTFLAGEENGFNYPSLRQVLFYNNTLWLGTSGKGVWLYDNRTARFRRPLFGDTAAARLNEEFVWRMEPMRNGNVFVATGYRCYVINRQWQTKALDTKTFKGISRSAAQDSAGRIWHSTARGVNVTDSSFRLLFRLQDSFPDRRTAALCEWRKNRMFIGTRGLYEAVSEGDGLKSFKAMQGFPAERFIYTMEKDAAGKIWLGTDEGLCRYDPLTTKCESFGIADNVQPQTFNSNGLYRSASGLMYAGGHGGFNYFDPLRIEKATAKPQPQIAAFGIGNDDSSFFLSAPPYTVSYFNRNLSAEVSVPEFEKPFDLRYRYKTGADEAWIDNGNSRFIRLNNLRPGDYNLIVSVSNDGLRWASASAPLRFTIRPPWWERWWFAAAVVAVLIAAGLLLVRNAKKRQRRKEQEATIDYFANSGYEHSDAEDILWDIARNCISRLGFEECVIYLVDAERNALVQKAAYGPKSPRQYEIANPIEIPVGQGITGAVAQTGVAEIVSDTTKDSRYVVDDEARKSEITVPILHNGAVIGVIDSESGRRNFFTKEHLQTLKTIASICSVKVARALSQAEMKKAEGLVRELNTKMLETKYLNLRLQMNPHFLFNALSSIQHLVVSQQTGEAYTYLSVFSNFLRSVLQYADRSTITLDEELKMLNMYIKLETLGSDKAFDFSIDVDESLEPEDVLVPPLMIQPVIENAIWHGLMQKEGERTLTVFFGNEGDEQLVCVVEDNGIGRKASAVLKKTALNNFAYESKAMTLIEERLRLLRQRTGKPAKIEIEDKCSEGLASGTKVTLTLPFYNPDEL